MAVYNCYIDCGRHLHVLLAERDLPRLRAGRRLPPRHPTLLALLALRTNGRAAVSTCMTCELPIQHDKVSIRNGE